MVPPSRRAPGWRGDVDAAERVTIIQTGSSLNSCWPETIMLWQ